MRARLLFAFTAVTLPAFACECVHLSACELIRQPVLFIGEVIDGGVASIRDDPWYSNVDHVRFRVLENLRGLPANSETVDVELMLIPGMCSPIPYYSGRKYLVAPSLREGKFWDGVCFQGRDVERAADEVREVRGYFAGKTPVHVSGQVAATGREDGLVRFLLSTGEAKALSGVTISTSRDGKNYSAVTDSEGRYTLDLPGTGPYQLRAALRPYYVPDPARVRVSSSGCAIRDFALGIDNIVSGKVLDQQGQPIKNAKVGLLDLDRTTAQDASFVDHAYTEQPDLSYRFVNVPLGRYLIVSNPDGPRSGQLSDVPLESTFYPNSNSRAEAREVRITSGGNHMTGLDVTAGRPIALRKVTVSVTFPDGLPMKTAEVRCTGLPAKDGDLPWKFRKVAMGKDVGIVEFFAPVNRELRIEISDWYGRDLKSVYASTHAPGTSDINQRFVVRP